MLHGKLFNEGQFFPAIALTPSLKLPTGKAVGDPDREGTDVTGSGSIDASLAIGLTKAFKPFVFNGSVGYTYAFATPVDGIDTHYGGALFWNAAVEWPFWPDVFGLQLEIAGRNQAAPEIAGIRQAGADIRQLVVGAGLEVLATPSFKMVFAYQRALAGRNASSTDSFLVAFVPTFF